MVENLQTKLNFKIMFQGGIRLYEWYLVFIFFIFYYHVILILLGKWEFEYGCGVGGLGELDGGMVDKHRWFSGRIIAFQAVDPGSIPGRCIFIRVCMKK